MSDQERKLSRRDFIRLSALAAVSGLVTACENNPVVQAVLASAQTNLEPSPTPDQPIKFETIPEFEPTPQFEKILNFDPVTPEEISRVLSLPSRATSVMVEGEIPQYFSYGVQHWWKNGKIQEWAKKWEIDPIVIAALIQIESGGDPHSVSPADALGLVQPTRDKFPEDQDPFDPDTNINAGLKYFTEGGKKAEKKGYKDIEALIQAAIGYNGGHSRIGKDISSLPKETQLFAKLFRGFLTGDKQIIDWFYGYATDFIPSADAAVKNWEQQTTQDKEIPERPTESSRVYDKEKGAFIPSVGRIYEQGKILIRKSVGTLLGSLNPWYLHQNRDNLWVGQDYITRSSNENVISPIDGIAELSWDPNGGYIVSISGTSAYKGLYFRIIHLQKNERQVGLVKRGQKIGLEGPQNHVHVIALWGNGTFSSENKIVPYSLLLGPNDQPSNSYIAKNNDGSNYLERFSPGPERFTWFAVK